MTAICMNTPAAPIDMLTPQQTCQRLDVAGTELLQLVNSAALPAYRLGEAVRFRSRDVEKLVSH